MKQVRLLSASYEQAVALREALNTYLRLFAQADTYTQEVCELVIAKIDEQFRGAESTAAVTLSPTGAEVEASGGPGTFEVTLDGEGSWAASASDLWLHIDGPTAPQTASGTVTFTVEANNGVAGEPASDRVGTIYVNDSEFTVAQAPYDVLPVELSPTGASLDAAASAGNTFSVTVTGSGANGTWTVDTLVAAEGWLHVTSPTAPESASGSVTYSVDGNLGGQREGKFFVNGQPFTVTQGGA